MAKDLQKAFDWVGRVVCKNVWHLVEGRNVKNGSKVLMIKVYLQRKQPPDMRWGTQCLRVIDSLPSLFLLLEACLATLPCNHCQRSVQVGLTVWPGGKQQRAM